MTRSEFETAANRVKWIGMPILSCVLLLNLVYIHFIFIWLQAHHILGPPAPGQPKPDGWDGLRFGAEISLIVCPPLGISLWLCCSLTNRFFGLRCPHCQRYVTLRCMPEIVLESGRCPFCKEKLFEGGDEI
jgi:hypothetical protein